MFPLLFPLFASSPHAITQSIDKIIVKTNKTFNKIFFIELFSFFTAIFSDLFAYENLNMD